MNELITITEQTIMDGIIISLLLSSTVADLYGIDIQKKA